METKVNKISPVRCTKTNYANIRMHLKMLAYGGKDAKIKINKIIQKQSDKTVNKTFHMICVKNSISYEARHYQLLLGFLSGKNYKDIEKSTRDNNKPNIKLINALLTKHVFINKKDEQIVSDMIQSWINGIDYANAA